MTRFLIRSFSPETRKNPAPVAGRLVPAELRRRQGAEIDLPSRFESLPGEGFDDGWTREERQEQLATEVTFERPNRIMACSKSPDIAFDRSVDAYRGCAQGCFYCFTRPGRVRMGVHAGLDCDHRIVAKQGAPELLERELGAAGYWPAPIALGANADPYLPIERRHRVTRSLLEVLQRARHPLSIITKSNLILRDLDILRAMGRDRLVRVFVSVPTLDREVARKMEPQAPTPDKRLETIEALNDVGVPTGVMIAPIIPAINDSEIETILSRACAVGARDANYEVLCPPLEMRDALRERLLGHYPDRLRRAVSLMQGMYDGADRDARRCGSGASPGPYAWMVKRRFETAARRLGYRETPAALRADLFRKPAPAASATAAPAFGGYGRTEARAFAQVRSANP